MARELNNSEDILDSRDIIARIEHLQQLRQPGPVDLGDDNDTDQDTLFAELTALEKLAAEAEGCADWEHGEALIRESYFQDYAMQLAEDIGAIKGDESWPLSCIDWEKAARELKYDYTTVDFDGVDYLIRS